MTTPVLRIASRGSPLALAQSRLVRTALAAAHGWASDLDAVCPIIAMKTAGDRIQDRPLVEAGGKGLFVKEIEDALLVNAADIAVHSMKDMPAVQPEGLIIAAVLTREDPRDIFISKTGAPFAALRQDATLGTSSVRRQAQALRMRPDLKIVSLRGNVETRIAKLARDEADAIILAKAGVSRLKIALPMSEILDDFLPALCQGAIGVEVRLGDTRTLEMVRPIDHAATHLAVACERGFLAALDGSCRTPIAGLAKVERGRLAFTGEVLTLDGGNFWRASRAMAVADGEQARQTACALGREAANEVRLHAGDKLPRF
jgi:hydroxymethylbilane synthase